MILGYFRDSAVYDPETKTAVSVRDGVLEYRGAELGMQDLTRVYRVYRSPATIANAAAGMPGIPLTDDHVALDIEPPRNGGEVASAEMVDVIDERTGATIAIRNTLILGDTLAATVDTGKRELSLGYRAKLVAREDSDIDFDQVEIEPHHLAVVDSGRCGSMCSFIDHNPTEANTVAKLHKAFLDAEGAMNLQQIVELATALPEAIKSVPVDQLQELLPALQQIVEAAKGVMPAPEEEVEEIGDMPPEDDEPIKDEDEPKEEMLDSAAVQLLVDSAVVRHGAAVSKARLFLADGYDYTGKTTEAVMRDALATESAEEFKDSELETAFKLLKKQESNYKQFGDESANKFEALKSKEI